MRITLIFTGKTRSDYLAEGIKEYCKRISRYAPFEIVTTEDLKGKKKNNQSFLKIQEGKQVLQRLKPGDHLILLDEKGKRYNSREFADHLVSLEGKTGHLVFLIGGAYGFSDDVYSRADEQLSLSEMTFSHQMVRLIFTEQLYRAFTILNGEPYHHN
ncbi:MAG: 23S rRNA (pseudouridine(1915)-N(3))-methyltransferase RlmH [Bacteroidales bacterium]|nr:23S rRNA (pseudouridine(1915)-N(3))-methyltransferase RlmH [Bacteroidales bacterium]